jgi:hypothetical protein
MTDVTVTPEKTSRISLLQFSQAAKLSEKTGGMSCSAASDISYGHIRPSMPRLSGRASPEEAFPSGIWPHHPAMPSSSSSPYKNPELIFYLCPSPYIPNPGRRFWIAFSVSPRVKLINHPWKNSFPGRLLIMFPGRLRDSRIYRFMADRDGFNYMAVPITSTTSFIDP